MREEEKVSTLRNGQNCEMRSRTGNLRVLSAEGGEGVSLRHLLLASSAKLFHQLPVSPQDQQVRFPFTGL